MRLIRTAVAVGVLAVVTALTGPAFGAADGSGYGQWSLGGGALTVPLAGFPPATVTTDSSRSQVAGGTSAFLGASTPFAHTYGSSQGKQYLVLGTAATLRSTTTISFSAPPPTGWGFALGDVDADTVRVAATGADGRPVTATDLGWQSAFNYCRNTPRPPSCTGPGPFTDLPRWRPATATLTGNVADTSGAAGWFRPMVPLTSLTLTFTAQAGIPSYQLWLAALPVSISGRVGTDCGRPATPVVLRLLAEDGSPVMAADGDPVTTTSAADGTFTFPGVTAGHYQVAAGAGARTAVDAGTDVSDVALTLTCPAVPTTAPTRAAGPAPTAMPPAPVTVDGQPGGPTTITLLAGLVVTHVGDPGHGSARVNPDGTITYFPDRGFAGVDRICYTARTRAGATVTGVLIVRILLADTGVNVLPVVAIGALLLLTGAGTLLLLRRHTARR
jgi:hypothetical protein